MTVSGVQINNGQHYVEHDYTHVCNRGEANSASGHIILFSACPIEVFANSAAADAFIISNALIEPQIGKEESSI